MKIAIFDLTLQEGALYDGIPRVGHVIAQWLAPAMPDATFLPHWIAYGANLPALDTFDGLLLSGSELGVYDAAPWIGPLRAYLHKARAAQKPIFGICFGHQLMADEFGGKAEKSVQGNHVGVREFEMGGAQVNTMVWHGDQVTAVPPGAQITGSAPYCPVGALRYDFPAMSVQFHPEYSAKHLSDLFDLGEALIDQSQAAAAKKTFDEATVSADLMAAETAAFFRANVLD